jgi:hypothetical protein
MKFTILLTVVKESFFSVLFTLWSGFFEMEERQNPGSPER